MNKIKTFKNDLLTKTFETSYEKFNTAADNLEYLRYSSTRNLVIT